MMLEQVFQTIFYRMLYFFILNIVTEFILTLVNYSIIQPNLSIASEETCPPIVLYNQIKYSSLAMMPVILSLT